VATLAPMPIRKLPGVGPATQERLHRRGLHTIGEVAAVDLADLIDLLGQAHGLAIHQHARGIDDRVLEPDREAKSVSAETTFPTDLTDQRELAEHARRLINRVIVRLVKDGASGRTITLKIRSYDFSTITRSVTLDQPTDSAAKILSGAKQLLSAIDTSNGIRLLGVGVSGLSDYAQQDLLADLVNLADSTTPAVEAAGAVPVTGVEEGGDPVQGTEEDVRLGDPIWTPGQDVHHAERGAGWVQGAGSGRVTVRFEGPHTGPGPIATYAITDPALTPAEPPVW
jgi:DNA polymerase-4